MKLGGALDSAKTGFRRGQEVWESEEEVGGGGGEVYKGTQKQGSGGSVRRGGRCWGVEKRVGEHGSRVQGWKMGAAEKKRSV